MPKNLPRKYFELIYRVSGQWTNWDFPIHVHLGDFGTVGRNGEFTVDGNIYSDEFKEYLKGIKSPFNLDTYPVKFTEFDQNYTAYSSNVKRQQFDVDKFVNVAGNSSASFKETWKFQDGKRGALLILISSYTISIPEVILGEILEAKRLEGKHLVTMARICPAYLKLLSTEETISVAFSPPASGVDVANAQGAGWWTDARSELLRRDTHPHGKPIFTPLFSLKQCKQSRWQDFYPTWRPLNEDGETSVGTAKTYPEVSRNNNREFIDLVHKVSGKYTNLDPPIPVTVGAYGTLDQNGEFNVDGNIYSDDFQKYLDENSFNFVARDYQPRLAEPNEDYIVASSGVTRSQLDPDQPTNPAIRSASLKGTWKFRDGKRGVLIILVKPRTSFIPNEILAKMRNVELLRGRHVVTDVLACPAYLMYLSNKSTELFSTAFCAKTQGDVVHSTVGGEWWTEGDATLLLSASHPNGEYRFMPLFALKQTLKRGLFNWRGEYQPTGEEYLWQDAYPDWKPLDEDGEELED